MYAWNIFILKHFLFLSKWLLRMKLGLSAESRIPNPTFTAALTFDKRAQSRVPNFYYLLSAEYFINFSVSCYWQNIPSILV
jgi:hypothetical protein